MKAIQGHPNLKKGPGGIIINVSDSDRERYRQSKMMALKQRESQDEIQELKSELKEVKELLHQLLKNNGT